MDKDICVRCGEGVVNIRVGAIIIKDNKVLIQDFLKVCGLSQMLQKKMLQLLQ